MRVSILFITIRHSAQTPIVTSSSLSDYRRAQFLFKDNTYLTVIRSE